MQRYASSLKKGIKLMMRNENKELTSYKMYKEAQEQYLTDINRPLIQSGNNELIITDNNGTVAR
ncbi:MAG: hypothetical protein ACIPMY_07010 [Rickettsia endosymbiont of Pentastiridius leporinus]